MSTRAATTALVLCLLINPKAALAADEPSGPAIVRIKKDPLVLVDSKGDETSVPGRDIKLPWAVKRANDDGSFQVDYRGQTYSVAPWFVQVKGMTTLSAPPACLDNKDTRLAATRNAGEACTPKK